LIIGAGVFGFRVLIYKPETEAIAKTPPLAPLVYTAAIRSHEGSLDFKVDGVVAPYREIAVAAEVAGKVVFKDESCDSGRFVTQGTPLIKIDPQDYQIAVQRLENQLEQADASIEELQVEIGNSAELIKLAEDQVELERKEIDRLSGLIQERIVTDSTLDRAKQTELAARNGLVQLKNQLQLLRTRQRRLESARDLVVTDLKQAKLDLARTEIAAAVDGVVIDDLVERDSYVQKGEPIFTLEDTSKVEVNCRLKMEDLYWVWSQTGTDFNGVLADRPGYEFPRISVTIEYRLADRQDVGYQWRGVLVHFTPFDGIGLDKATRTVPCRILVDNPRDVKVVKYREDRQDQVVSGVPPTLVRGMFVTATFHVDQPSPLLVIPERAVQPGKTVWIVRDGVLHEKQSLELIELIEVPGADGQLAPHWLVEASATDLAAGDQVVVPPFGILRDGDAVRVSVAEPSVDGEVASR